jgi:hypothetical protein
VLGGSVAVASKGEALPVMSCGGRESLTLADSRSVEESADPLREDWPGVGMRRLPAEGVVLLEEESGLTWCW